MRTVNHWQEVVLYEFECFDCKCSSNHFTDMYTNTSKSVQVSLLLIFTTLFLFRTTKRAPSQRASDASSRRSPFLIIKTAVKSERSTFLFFLFFLIITHSKPSGHREHLAHRATAVLHFVTERNERLPDGSFSFLTIHKINLIDVHEHHQI